MINIETPTRSVVATPPRLLEPMPESDTDVFARMEAILRKIASNPPCEFDHAQARAMLLGLPTADYTRVSSGRQGDGYGPASQRRDHRRKIERYGLVEPHLHYEDHITATGKVVRTDFVRMRADARAGKFKILLVGRVDRFARNALMGWLYIYELIACGIYVFFCDDDNVCGLDLGWKARVTKELDEAEAFIRRLTENLNKSVVERREDGIYVGSVGFGWRRGPDRNPAIDPTCINTVKRAFAIALSHDELKLASVAQQLNAEGHRFHGKLFDKSRVHRILTNPLAKGAWKVHKVGVSGVGKASWEEIPGKCEAIVSVSQFDLLRELLSDRAEGHRDPERTVHEYVLGRLLRCGEALPSGDRCDERFWSRPSGKHQRRRYQHRIGVGCCAATPETTYWVAERGLVEQLTHLFSKAHLPQSAVEVIHSYLKEREGAGGQPAREQLLASYENELKRLDIAFRRGVYGEEPLPAEAAWQVDRRAVQAKIDALPPVPEMPTEADRATVLDLFALWRNSAPAAQRRLLTAVFSAMYVTRSGGPALTRAGKVRRRGGAGIVRIVARPEHSLLLALAFEDIKSDSSGRIAPVEQLWEVRPFMTWVRRTAA